MTLFGLALETYWWWLILALVLAIAEIMVPGVFLIWIGGAALITGLLSLLFALPTSAEFVVFAIAAVGAVYAGRRWLAENPIVSDDPMLNDRGARLIGRNVVVVQPLIGGEGRVKVGDSVWNATGPDAPEGARVTIVGVEGSRLKVEPAED